MYTSPKLRWTRTTTDFLTEWSVDRFKIVVTGTDSWGKPEVWEVLENGKPMTYIGHLRGRKYNKVFDRLGEAKKFVERQLDLVKPEHVCSTHGCQLDHVAGSKFCHQHGRRTPPTICYFSVCSVHKRGCP